MESMAGARVSVQLVFLTVLPEQTLELGHFRGRDDRVVGADVDLDRALQVTYQREVRQRLPILAQLRALSQGAVEIHEHLEDVRLAHGDQRQAAAHAEAEDG